MKKTKSKVVDLQARKLEAEAKQDALIPVIGEFVQREFRELTPAQHGLIATFIFARFDLFKALVDLRDEGHLENWMILGIASQYFRDHVAPWAKEQAAAEGEGSTKPAIAEEVAQ